MQSKYCCERPTMQYIDNFYYCISIATFIKIRSQLYFLSTVLNIKIINLFTEVVLVGGRLPLIL